MEEKEVKISFWASHLTLIVSVTFVLMLIGIISVVGSAVTFESQRLQERIEINVVMADSVPTSTTMAVAKKIAHQPYSHNVRLVGKKEAMERWKADTGEDLLALYGVNPLSEEISFNVDSRYASPEQIGKIKSVIQKFKGVEAVDAPDPTIIAGMNRSLSNLTLILAVVAGIMLLVTFVLINNTVHLTIYSRRFTIHTMQLVGATKGFISKPIVINNVLGGLLAGVFASILTGGVVYASSQYGLDVLSIANWDTLLIIAGGLILCGMFICGASSFIATRRYLRKDYDSLFK